MTTSTPTTETRWTDWSGVLDAENRPSYSGFKVEAADGQVEMAQVGPKNFRIATRFAFCDADTLAKLQRAVEGNGHSPGDARTMVDAARTFGTDGQLTDLASVPRFIAWFESSYGRHTLAAMIHDRLITDGDPNTGALGSDSLSDSFFRDMMGVAGVPVFKRWIMWAAVAMRTRWAARGRRRLTLVLWGVCAVVGNVCAIAAAGQAVVGWGRLFDIDPWLLFAIAVVLPFVSGLLWGKQFGASVVAAAAGIWLTPAAAIAFAGLIGYAISEKLASRGAGHHGIGDATWDPPTTYPAPVAR